MMSLAPEPPLVVIVDDDESVRSALQGLMKSLDLPVQAFASAEEFLASGQQAGTRCLITDLRMPGMSGLELQSVLNATRCSVPTIFITAHGDERAEAQALRAGAVAFVTKPFDDATLIATIREVLERGT
ncbi:MAG TPA: response regulator [Bryobacteraceae bacterium]|nr:response regulator [Bryobacteraceae bacterium]